MDIDERLVRLNVNARDAEDAIALAGQLLVDAERVTSEYVKAMVEAFRTIGPYIVLAPNIAMPHARPEHGALREGVAVLRLAEPIAFGHPDNDPVRIVIPLAGTDPVAHIEVLRHLAGVLMDPDARTTLFESDDTSLIAALFSTHQEG